MTAPAVSVVIPAYNAARTLDETLRSVRAQTHTALEILVVDDGSSDATSAIADAHANEDSRIRVIRQPNAGVAAARNTGWTSAAHDLIAFIDADDLWHPRKIELQLAALARSGPRTGLVYCFFSRIDANGDITERWDSTPHAGEVFDDLLRHNFVGNGSTMLVTRAALTAARGFENSLHQAGAQGCDDYLMCCRVAESFEFAVAPENLVGYRDSPHSVSSDNARMLRSWMLAMEQLAALHPAKKRLLRMGLYNYVEWMIRRAVFQRQPGQIPPVLRDLARRHPRVAARVVIIDLPRLGVDIARRLADRALRRASRTAKPVPARERFPVGTSLAASEPARHASV